MLAVAWAKLGHTQKVKKQRFRGFGYKWSAPLALLRPAPPNRALVTDLMATENLRMSQNANWPSSNSRRAWSSQAID
jgi:hypothetical protein